MEKFYIENESGQRYDFQNYAKVAMRNPNGLGFSKSNSYIEVGNYFVLTTSKKNQKKISIELEFFNNSHVDFFEFVTFLKSSSEYKLIYETSVSQFLIDIDIVEIPKSGIKKGNTIITSIDMIAKSLWYKRVKQQYSLEPVSGESRWDVKWDFLFNDYPSTSIDITNNGQEESSFEFVIYGYAKNPRLEVYNNNVLVNLITFNIEILNNQKILFSNRDNDLYVQLQNSDGTIENALNSLTLENDNFFKLKRGDSTLSFKADDPIQKIDFVMFEDYEVV